MKWAILWQIRNKCGWISYSNAEDDETLDRLAKDSPVMEKAVAVLRRMSADEKELYEIEQRDKALRDEVSARKYERQQGFAQGIEGNETGN